MLRDADVVGPSGGVAWGRFLAVLLCALACAAPGSARAASDACLVCGKDPALGDAQVVYRGVAYPVCEVGCEAAWRQAEQADRLDAIVQRVEPRSALFQADSRFLNPVHQQANPMSSGWMLCGLWVLLAVGSAGIAGYLAMGADRSVPAAFAAGLVFPIVGIGLSTLLPRTPGTFGLRGSKIPVTHAPLECARCGHALHPSAGQCPGCGAPADATVESEVEKVRKRPPAAEGGE